MNDFESELKKQPLRQVPSHWRVEILAASEVAKPEPRPAWQWWDLLWPSPKAWGTLAAAWLVMVCFHLTSAERREGPQSSQAGQIRMAVEQKRRLQAEIEEAAVHFARETPKPRSEISHGGKSA